MAQSKTTAPIRQAESAYISSPEQFNEQVKSFLQRLNQMTQMNGLSHYFDTICGLDIHGEAEAPYLAITITLMLTFGMDEEHCLEDGDLAALLARVQRMESRPDLIAPCRWCLMAISASLYQALLGNGYRRSTH